MAARFGLGIDYPGDRKVHDEPTARLGGVAVFPVLLVALAFVEIDRAIMSILVGVTIVFVVGLLDDLRGLTWHIKMACIVGATLVIVFYGGIRLDNLGDLLGYGPVELGILAVPVTCFCVLGVVSATNMIDGLNGLAGGVSLIALLFFAYFAHLAGETGILLYTLVLSGAVSGFLVLNFPKGRVFLGDSGSMLIGFFLGSVAVYLFQGRIHFEPMVPVWVLALPIYDTLRVMAVRGFSGKNPFRADSGHIHHILIGWGMTRVRACVVIWVFALAAGSVAVVFKDTSGWKLFASLIAAAVLLSIVLSLMSVKKNGGQAGQGST